MEENLNTAPTLDPELEALNAQAGVELDEELKALNEMAAAELESEAAAPEPEVPDASSQASFWDSFARIPRMAVRAVDAAAREGMKELQDFNNEMESGLAEGWNGPDAKPFIKWYEPKPVLPTEDIPDLGPWVGKREEGVLGFVEGLAQFGVGMSIGAGTAKQLGLTGKTAVAAFSDMMSSAAFTENDENLSNQIQELASHLPAKLQGPVIAAMSVTAVDADDEAWEKNLKSVAEGVLMERAVGLLLWGVKSFRARKLGKEQPPIPEEVASHGSPVETLDADPLMSFHAADEVGPQMPPAVAAARASADPTDPLSSFHEAGVSDPLQSLHGRQENPSVSNKAAEEGPVDPLSDFHSEPKVNDPLAEMPGESAADRLKAKPLVSPEDPLAEFHGPDNGLAPPRRNEVQPVPPMLERLSKADADVSAAHAAHLKAFKEYSEGAEALGWQRVVGPNGLENWKASGDETEEMVQGLDRLQAAYHKAREKWFAAVQAAEQAHLPDTGSPDVATKTGTVASTNTNQAKRVRPAPKGVNIGRAEGGYQVTIDGRPVGPVVGTYNEAQALGVTAEVVHKNDSLPLGSVLDEDLEAFKQHGDGSKIRVAYAQGRNEALGVINQLAQPGMPTSIVGREKPPRPSKAKGGKPWARPKVLELAESVFPGKKGQAAIDEAIAVLGDADPVTIGPRIQALRTWTHAQVANISRLRALADGGKNAIAQHELGRALDTLARVYNIFPDVAHAEAHAPDAFSDAARMAAKESAEAAPKAAKGKPPKPPKAPAATTAQAPKAAEAPAPVAAKEKPSSAPKQTKEKPNVADDVAPEGSPQVFEGKTRKEVQALNTTLEVAGDDPKAILEVLRGPSEKVVKEVAKKNPGLARKVGDFMQAWRINAMLSGHITHLGNIASNAGVMFLRPMEMGLAGVFQGNTAQMREGWDLTTGLFLSIKDSLKMAGQAFKKGDGILDAGAGTFDLSHPTIGEWSFNSPKAYGTLPSRMLMTEDEFFKQMNYRAKVRADILREARERGITDKASLKKLVEEGLSLTFDGQKGMVSQSGLDYARYNTFTTPFEKDTFMGDIQSALQRDGLPAWIGRQVIPFLRTPTRIFEFAVERTPGVNLFHKEMRDSLFGRKGPEAAAQAYAKLTTGTAMYAAGYFMAGAGIITGSGPSDPTLRATMMSQGWKPYSVRVGDTYIPYNRLHPLTSALGVMADYVSISGELEDEENGQAAAAIITMLSARSSDNTFVTGLHEFLEVATSENPADVERYLAAYAGSYTPNALHQANPDAALRETRDWMDQLKKKVPGFSEDVEPRRNIFGEVALKNPGGSDIAFHPFTSSTVEDPEIFNEMVELGRGLQMPSSSMSVKGGGKLDLKDRTKYDNGTGKSPYNRMLEIIGGPMGSDGLTLREQIRGIIRSPDYQKAEKHDGYKPGGDRWNAIQKVINQRQQAAQGKVLSEYPLLQEAMQAEMAFGLAGKHGGKKAAEQAKRNVQVESEMKRTEALFAQ